MKTVYTVGEAAALLGVSTQMIRKYEEAGLLTPKRGENNYRFYESPDITMLMRIRLLRNLGFSLDNISQIMSPSRRSEIHSLFDDRITQMNAEIDRLRLMIACARLHDSYYEEYNRQRGRIRMERMPRMRCILYRDKRAIRPSFLKGDLLSQVLANSPPFQYMIRLPREREVIRAGEYEVGLAIPPAFDQFVPCFESELVLPEQLCVTAIICHAVEKKDALWESISLDQAFEDSGVYQYLLDHELTLSGDVVGTTYFDEIEGNIFTHYIKYYFPVAVSDL